MSSSDSKLFDYAIKEATEAVAYDKNGEYQLALNKYQRAAEILIQFMKFNKNPYMRSKCDQISIF